MFDLIIPFHSDFKKLALRFEAIRQLALEHDVNQVLFCHNGAVLPAPEFLALILDSNPSFKYLHCDAKGLGHAYRMGIQHSTAEFCILSASDLPFGDSDLEEFLKIKNSQEIAPDIVLGSKAHPDSELSGIPSIRRIYSNIFLFIRRFLLGKLSPGDSQGTLILKTSIARALLDKMKSEGFMFSLELVSLYIHFFGRTPIEVPVKFYPTEEKSSVRPIRDGIKMILAMIALRARLTSIAPEEIKELRLALAGDRHAL